VDTFLVRGRVLWSADASGTDVDVDQKQETPRARRERLHTIDLQRKSIGNESLPVYAGQSPAMDAMGLRCKTPGPFRHTPNGVWNEMIADFSVGILCLLH